MRTRARAVAISTGVYGLAVVALHPFANLFYGGDDWAYGWSVRVLVEEGRLRASDWVAAAAVPQTFWAAGFCRLFGVHPGVMNGATLVASFIGVALLHLVGMTLGLSELLAGIAAVLIAVGPLYLGFASSFMSDCYYAVLLVASAFAYLRALRSGSPWASAIGGALASLAFLNRQIGLAIPPAFVAGVMASYVVGRASRGRALAVAAAGSVFPACVMAAYRLFPDSFGGQTAVQRVKMSSAALWNRMTKVGLSISHGHLELVYIGVFIAPLVVVLLSGRRSREILTSKPWRVPFFATLLVSVLGCAYVLFTRESLIVRGELLHTASFGAAPLAYMNGCWTVLAFIGSVALSVFLVLAVERVVTGLSGARRGAQKPEVPWGPPADRVPELVFLGACLCAHWLLSAVFIAYYNNYFLPLVVLAGAMVCAVHGGEEGFAARRARGLGAILVGFTGLASVVVLDAHMRYVEADARLVKELVAAGADSNKVFGYAGTFAWDHVDIVHAEVQRKPWGPLERIRARARIVLLNPEERPRNRRLHRARREKYRTLLGQSEIVVWER